MSKVEKIKSITKRMQSLPTLPQVVKQFTAMVENPDVTAHEVGKLISSDQVLAGKVLRLVNSPFYGFPGRISSVSHSIILLGFDDTKGVVLSASAFDTMEQAMLGLWEHSLGSAVAVGALCRGSCPAARPPVPGSYLLSRYWPWRWASPLVRSSCSTSPPRSRWRC